MSMESAIKKLVPANVFPFIWKGIRDRGYNAVQAAHFISQCGHESSGFTKFVENMNYSAQGMANTWPTRFAKDAKARAKEPNALALSLHRKPQGIANVTYGGRMGNTLPDDGWFFRGRSGIHITGRAMYRKASEGIYQDMRLLTNPELLEVPEHAILGAFWYWDENRLANVKEKDIATEIRVITRRINGGLNGLDDRVKRFDQATAILSPKK